MAKKKASKKGQPLRRWTKEEDERLLANVDKHVLCLTKAFELTSLEVQRSPKAVAAHWYQITSKGAHTKFGLFSNDFVVRNRKNAKANKAKKMPKGIFQRILKLLKLVY